MVTGDVKYKHGHYSLVFTRWFCFILRSALLASKCSVIIAFNWVENKTVVVRLNKIWDDPDKLYNFWDSFPKFKAAILVKLPYT